MDTTYEYCRFCEEEVEISANVPSECPKCHMPLLPCSTCTINFDEESCEFSADIDGRPYCKRFPYGGGVRW